MPLQVLLPAASLLQLMDVRKNCCDFLQSQLHPTNCLGIRAFADVHACTELLQQANAYAGEGRGSGCGADPASSYGSSEAEPVLAGPVRLLVLEQEGNILFSSGLATLCDAASCEMWFGCRGVS